MKKKNDKDKKKVREMFNPAAVCHLVGISKKQLTDLDEEIEPFWGSKGNLRFRLYSVRQINRVKRIIKKKER